ncbi:MAG: glucosaminidase domain-containing protein [Acidimicrobiales bacterium]
MHLEPSLSTAVRRAPRRVLALAAIPMVVLGLLAGPAAARPGQATPTTAPDVDPPKTQQEQEDAKKALLETLALAPKDVPPSPDDPFAELATARAERDDAALARIQITKRSNLATFKAVAAADALKKSVFREDAANHVRDAAEAKLSAERKRLSDLTVQAYIRGGDSGVEDYRALLDGDTTDPSAGRQIIFSQVLERQKAVTERSTIALKVARRRARAAYVQVIQHKELAGRLYTTAANLAKRRGDAERRHVEAMAAVDEADKALRGASAGTKEMVPLDVPLIGLPRLTAEDLAGWFASSAYRPRTATKVEDFARWFIAEGNAEGIRGDVAFAQAVLETGGFTNTDSVMGNNFSGIGHYDNVPLGFQFPTPRLGVRAQIQLLKAYAVKKPQYANDLVDKRLRGPAGCCPTWGDLTSVWATSTEYGPQVMLLYTGMVDYALKRRARGEGFDDPPAIEG